MRKIVYVSTEWYAQTDMPVIEKLLSNYNVFWFYIYNGSIPRFNLKEITDFANKVGASLNLYDFRGWYLSLSSFKTQNKIISDIKKIKPDIVFRVSINLFWHLLSFRLSKFLVVYGIHDAVPHSNTKGAIIINWVLKHTIKANKYFVLYSKYQYDLFMDRWPQKKAANVRLGLISYGESLLSPGSLNDGVKLLFFGRLESYKGLDNLIATIEELYSEGITNLKLSVYGKGEFWKECEPLVKTRNLYNLHIRFVETHELADIFSTHHFLVLPYRDATQSGPIMIAANYALPIIASDIASFREVYNDDCGVFYKQGSLKEALCKVSKLTDTQYEKMQNEAKEVKREYTDDAVALRYITFFDSLKQ